MSYVYGLNFDYIEINFKFLLFLKTYLHAIVALNLLIC